MNLGPLALPFTRVTDETLQSFVGGWTPTLRFRADPGLDIDAWEDIRYGPWPEGVLAFRRHGNGHCFIRDDVLPADTHTVISREDAIRMLSAPEPADAAGLERAARAIYYEDESYEQLNNAGHEGCAFESLSEHDQHRYRDRARAAVDAYRVMP